LKNLEQIDAVLGVPTHYLVSLDMVHIVEEDLLAEKIDQCLDAICRLLGIFVVLVVQQL
jgi:hypothetical protein